MRGLSYLLGVDHSYHSHEPNGSVIAKNNSVLNGVNGQEITWEQFSVGNEAKGENYKDIKLAGDIMLDRQKRPLGHIIRRDPNDLQRKVAFDIDLSRPHQL